ncbi:MAG: thiamine pyrophosphate-dependent enzyme, partial [Alphaproteobacteria bacterium]|nr:thiamine pyrophosphate-dependent enzyme [Alphaproteobacteria bacterium]
ELGKISKEQRAGKWPVWETDLHNPSFAAFAKLCGGHGERVTQAGAVKDTIVEALAHKGPALVEIMTDAELV